MMETNQSLLDAEKEMALAVKKINEGINNLEEFKSASEALNDIAAKNETVLTSLLEVAQHFERGAKQLNEKGIAEFNTTIANSLTTTQDSITEVISENNKDITDKLSQKLKVLQTSVITLGLLNLALLAYVAFGAI